jgi:hypothetical protein
MGYFWTAHMGHLWTIAKTFWQRYTNITVFESFFCGFDESFLWFYVFCDGVI